MLFFHHHQLCYRTLFILFLCIYVLYLLSIYYVLCCNCVQTYLWYGSYTMLENVNLDIGTERNLLELASIINSFFTLVMKLWVQYPLWQK